MRDECEQLTGDLLTVAKEMGESETAVQSSLKGVQVPAKAGEKG
ncbi:hypothetical protein [Streptomyces sp. MNU77]|nr:hypothetical protein [Streptomyces sp. MNU77]